jgi:hypothetical protein
MEKKKGKENNPVKEKAFEKYAKSEKCTSVSPLRHRPP